MLYDQGTGPRALVDLVDEQGDKAVSLVSFPSHIDLGHFVALNGQGYAGEDSVAGYINKPETAWELSKYFAQVACHLERNGGR